MLSYGGSASYVPAPTNVPGTYGGPPGSFITTSHCPGGYNSVPLSRGDIRCVPKPQPVYRAPEPAPPKITIAPVFQQEFTPQFSPVLQQQQDSPGAAQSATPRQEVVTSQVATPTISSEITPAIIPEIIPEIITAPFQAPASDPYISPSVLPVPVEVPKSITAPTLAPVPKIEKELFMPSEKNYFPLILIGGAIALFYGANK
ncbi:MAG: hypothetical protein ABW166_04955 [Sedimenticola sp.]